MPRGRLVALALAAACAVLGGGLTACAAPDDPRVVSAAATTPAPTAPTAGNGEPTTTPVADGPEDPTQATRRTGPVAQYGGPPYGLQGPPESLEAGVWCATVGLFWGGAAPPANVTFTITGIAASPAGTVDGTAEGCGAIAPGVPCLGFTMTTDTGFTACSLTLEETAQFSGSAEVTFVGTLECSAASFCDAAQAREAEPGPAIIITSAPATPQGG